MRSTDDEHRFRAVLVGDGDRGIRQGMTYHVVAGDATSQTYTISVEQPPTSHVTEVRYVYPAYMNLPERTDSMGTIEAWEDTTVTVHAESSEPVAEAVLQMSDDAAFTAHGEELQMAIDGNQLQVDWKLTHREDGTFPKFYRIQVADAEDHRDLEPVVYAVDVRRDQPPALRLVDPTRDLQIAANAIVPLLIEAEDPDFLLRSVTLHYSVNGKMIQPSEVLLDAFQTGLTKRWTDTWEFRLKPLNLNPGDIVTYHLEARDNRPPLGNQARTGDLNLQITEPVSEKQAQEQLAQDRQMQDQMKQPDNANPGAAQQQPGEDQASEPPKAGEQTGEPMPNDEQSDESKQETADGTQGEKAGSEQPGQKGGSSQKTGKDGDRDPNQQPGKSTEPNQPGQENASGRTHNRPAEDDKALQKAIEHLNRERKESGNEGDGKQESTGEDRRPGTEQNSKRGDREPGEKGDGDQNSGDSKGGKKDDTNPAAENAENSPDSATGETQPDSSATDSKSGGDEPRDDD
ncbi:MAG TPA: hypothetical protein PK992_20155, partial [Planctomycetaceae bacterium]|nr:hypothetical protein [Planctomycetaceae bacterium]